MSSPARWCAAPIMLGAMLTKFEDGEWMIEDGFIDPQSSILDPQAIDRDGRVHYKV